MAMKARGFTLVELMIVVAIVAMLTMLAVPAFNDLIERRRVSGAAEEVFNQIAFARMEAVKRSRIIRADFSAANSMTWRFGITDDLGTDWDDVGCEPTVRVAGTGAKTDEEVAANTGATAESCSIDNDGNSATTGDRLLYQFTNADFSGVKMRGWKSNAYSTAPIFGASDRSYVGFDPTRGTVDTSTGSGSGRVVLCIDKKELHVEVNALGRVNICTPDVTYMPAYRSCTSPTTAGGC